MTRFVVALAAEARPLVRRYGLRKDSAHTAFSVFRSSAHSLVVTGVGRVAAAAGVSYLHAAVPVEEDCAWINVGLAGHGDRPAGAVVRAARIEEAATERRWFPPLIASCSASTETVRTVDVVEQEYRHGCAYDMEASAFVATAQRFATAELVQCLKIVSDGPEAGAVERIDRAFCDRLIESSLEVVEDLRADLDRIATPIRDEAGEPPLFDELIGRWRFTASERRQLRSVLERLAARSGVVEEDLTGISSAKSLIASLETLVDRLSLGVGGRRFSR